MIRSVIINKKSIESCEEANFLLPQIHQELIDLSYLYPGFKTWYEQKVLPGIILGERSLLVEIRNNTLAGVAIIKDDGLEKKLCCLRVLSEFQNKSGIGLKLFERSMDELNTKYPLLSVSNDKAHDFEKLFRYFGYKKSWEYPDLYRPQKIEFSFNGLILEPKANKKYRSNDSSQPINLLGKNLSSTAKQFTNFLGQSLYDF